MRTIGLRVDKNIVFWALIGGTSEQPILEGYDKIRSPATFDLPESLKWWRNQISNLINDHKPCMVGIRFQETFLPRGASGKALGSMLNRARIEGVLIEAACSLGLQVNTGALQSIASNMKSKSAKSYLESDDLRGMDLSTIRNTSQKEAILVGVATLGVVKQDADNG